MFRVYCAALGGNSRNALVLLILLKESTERKTPPF